MNGKAKKLLGAGEATVEIESDDHYEVIYRSCLMFWIYLRGYLLILYSIRPGRLVLEQRYVV